MEASLMYSIAVSILKDSPVAPVRVVVVEEKPHRYKLSVETQKTLSVLGQSFTGAEAQNLERLGIIHCSEKDCKLSYVEHIIVKAIEVRLTRHAKKSEVQPYFDELFHKLGEREFCGVRFIDTDKKYRLR